MSNNTILATAPLATTGFHIKATGTTLGNSLIWDNGTNVGIGNTNTSYTLEVTGTAKVSGITSLTSATASTSTSTGALVVTGGFGIGGALFGTSATFSSTLLSTGSGSNTVLSGTGLKVTSSNAGLYLNFSPSFTGGVEAEIASSENGLRIVAAGSGVNTMRFLTSNVSGVSTLALSISGTQVATFTNSVTIEGNGSTIRSGNELRFNRADNAIYTRMYDAGSLATNGFTFDNMNGEGFHFKNGGTTIMRMNSSNNVGIGTSSPIALLNIYGSTHLQLQNATTGSASSDGTRIQLSGNDLQIINRETADIILYTADTERTRITSAGNFDYGGFNAQSSNNSVYRQAFYGGFSIMWRNAEDTYINSNHTYSSANNNVATYTSSNGIGRLEFVGGVLTWYAYNGSVTAGTPYVATPKFEISKAGIVTINALGSGTVTATGGILSAVSDMNLKIEDGYIDNALEKVLKLKPRYYHWKEESKLPNDLRQLGFYAQEVNEALGEEAANTPKENEYFGINDRAIIAYLTKAIQEQQIQIQNLQEQINILAK